MLPRSTPSSRKLLSNVKGSKDSIDGVVTIPRVSLTIDSRPTSPSDDDFNSDFNFNAQSFATSQTFNQPVNALYLICYCNSFIFKC